jgi:PIN domain nuclease of toxin-antitoxin system
MHPERLSQKVVELIMDTGRYEELLLSAISPWEFSKLLEKGRLGISCDPEKWIQDALDMAKLRIIPLTPTISCRSTTLPKPCPGDPADQIIIATAREEKAVIITKDKQIIQYKHVQTFW